MALCGLLAPSAALAAETVGVGENVGGSPAISDRWTPKNTLCRRFLRAADRTRPDDPVFTSLVTATALSAVRRL
jgi:hypothetical protein